VESLERSPHFDGRRLSEETKRSLLGEPMDGAIIIDFDGKIRHAAVKLCHEQCRWILKKKDGTGVGTRHKGALGTAVWLSDRGQPYAVYVRSDGGGLHCLTGGGRGKPPQVWHVKCCEPEWHQDVPFLIPTLTSRAASPGGLVPQGSPP